MAYGIRDGMRIAEYDDIDPAQMTALNNVAFGWHPSEESVRRIRRLDPHVPDFFALYAMDGERAVGQVGAVAVPVETTEGRLDLGFIWGVCTRPLSAKRGIATGLMLESHRRLKRLGVRYCVLGTNRSFVAYEMYRKLGYRDLRPFLRGIWKPTGGAARDISFASSRGAAPVIASHRKYCKGLLGFVHRPVDFMKVRNLWFISQLNLAGIFRRGPRPVGHVLGSRDRRSVKVFELACPDPRDIPACVRALARRFRPKFMEYIGFARKAEAEGLVAGGFSDLEESWGTLMAVDLEDKGGFGRLGELLDIGSDRFQISEMDCY